MSANAVRALADKYARRHELDLVGFLNEATAAQLDAMCRRVALSPGTPGAMRQRLWAWGAAYERAALIAEPPPAVQPTPVLRGGRLQLPRVATAAGDVLPIARRARFPAAEVWPRPLPPTREPPATPPPETLDELLARADALVGVRLGARGRDKGHYGQRIAALLGVPHSSAPAPDWRGEVELKSLAVVRGGRGGGWRIKDGPALSMRNVDAREKLARVLWVVRVDEGEVPGSPVLCWYYQELDGELAAAFEASRHLRPKGGKGTTGRGWYLRRGFFDACGLMRALNGG